MVGRARTSWRDADGVSSVVGTTLMLAITISVFAGFSLVVMGEVSDGGERTRADLHLLQGEEVLLQHRGGDALALAQGRLLLNVDGAEAVVPLADLTAQLDGDWGVGETLCLSCLYPGASLDGVLLVYGNALLVSEGARGAALPAGIDLAPATPLLAPAAPAPGDEVTFSVTVRNLGADTAAATSLRFTLDGSVLAEPVVPSLAGGASTVVTATWTATSGDHTLLAGVDPDDDVAETDESNNDAQRGFTVEPLADPGFPYVDADGDGRYDPATDTPLDPAEVQDGRYDAGAGSLVIPASVGPITAASIDFRAGGDLVIAVDLTAINQELELQAGGNATLAGITLITEQGGPDLELQAGGWIDASNSTLESKAVTLAAAGGGIDAWGSSMTARNGDVRLTATQDVDARSAALTASRDLKITVGADGDRVLVDGAALADRNDRADITPDGAAVGTPASGGLE